jgi:hypothetical protein
MRAKELIKLELILSQVFPGLDESKKVDMPTLDLSQVVFYSADKRQIALALSWSYTTQIRAKELIKLELALSQVFLGLTSQHSTYPELFSQRG